MTRYGDEIAGLATPLVDPGDLDVLLDRVGDAQFVMLGEASHGTHEFYEWRAALTRRLVAERGFSFVAVEGDWPDCERVDHAVRSRDSTADPRAALAQFGRWPTWLWANEEVVDFCRWLRLHNLGRERPVGFHGLDVYSLWESLRAIITHLQEHLPAAVPAALAAYRCFEPYGERGQDYAVSTRLVPEGCADEVVDLLVRLRAEGAFTAWQNAEVVVGAERYYRAMLAGGRESWNVREQHMAETLDRLVDHYGLGAKCVVWAHNTHVGDARATSMAQTGELTVGQLTRERHGRDRVVLVGFGTHRGTVTAGDLWGAPARTMPVPPGRESSLEDVLHHGAPRRAVFVWPGGTGPDLLRDWLDHRAIGVVYHPERERLGNYVPTVLGDRYDAFLWFDEAVALRPLARTRALVP